MGSSRKKTCKRKIKHPTMKVAKQVAKYRSEFLGRVMYAYPCQFCDGFHIATSPIQKPTRSIL